MKLLLLFQNNNNKKKKIIGSLLVFVSAILFLLPTVSNVYIFDDEELVQGSQAIKSFDQIGSFFSGNMFAGKKDWAPLYRPLLMVSLYFNHVVFGHYAVAYHIVNLLLHALASLLFYYFIACFAGYSYRFLIPALIFAVHPVHVDAVAFIINRSEILVLVFLMVAAIILARDDGWRNFFSLGSQNCGLKIEKRLFATVMATTFFMAAFLSKETAASGFFVLFLFVLVKLLIKKRLSTFEPVGFGLILFTTTFFLYLAIRWLAVGTIGAGVELTIFKNQNFWKIFPTMSRIFAEYILLLVAPFSLKVDYSNYVVSNSFFEVRAIFSYILHLAIFAIALWRLKKNPVLSFCILCFYISLLPVSHIIPFFDIKAERFLYIPSLFYCLVISFPLKYFDRGHKYFRTVILLFLAGVLFYGSLSFNYATLFRSERLLWTEMVARDPENEKFQFSLGLHLWKSREYEDAIQHLEKVLTLDKRYIKAYAPLGVSYSLIGQKERAREAFLAGLNLDPNYVILNENYAVFNYFNGDFATAYYYIKRAKELDPKDKKIAIAMNEIEKMMKRKVRERRK